MTDATTTGLPTRRAYTLIELLAVVIVLGLVAGLTLPGLARRAAGDPLAEAVQRVLGQEQRLRSLAIGRGAHLDLSGSGFTARLDAGSDDQDGSSETRVDPTVLLTWRVGDHPVQELVIDRRGRSTDLDLMIERAGTTRHYRLAGLSGEWNAVETMMMARVTADP